MKLLNIWTARADDVPTKQETTTAAVTEFRAETAHEQRDQLLDTSAESEHVSIEEDIGSSSCESDVTEEEKERETLHPYYDASIEESLSMCSKSVQIDDDDTVENPQLSVCPIKIM